MSNASETEEMGEREPRPRGVGAEERGSRRGGRGRGSSTSRGRGGPGPRTSNTISSGASFNLSVCLISDPLFSADHPVNDNLVSD